DFYALKGVDLKIEPGEFFGCFGPNGAGKTTLLRILSGQLEPTKGSATVLGIDAKENPMEIKKVIGIVPEVESPPSYLTGREYLYFVGRVRKVEDLEKKIDHWLDFFDL
ncbi:MAG: ATP-binding cassette domain-containing protein, partial [Aliifodinibius sp.]|nr:ABC transporter ATP-binding protein [Fodinibius sp.]NIW39363.1 ATP-binding cassette domain-containing protein [candidate division Zixibacteria bacterium]NIX54483.1 ATP-binding cassette domain-containing protein [candidate division Zixibacteria bacterium]NIY23556.1 ATP-binding cassette domain-containing protein [Fodinibius sp.]